LLLLVACLFFVVCLGKTLLNGYNCYVLGLLKQPQLRKEGGLHSLKSEYSDASSKSEKLVERRRLHMGPVKKIYIYPCGYF
jgi:hypothetical protein